MVRHQVNFKRLSLTDIKIDIKRSPKKKFLIAAMEAGDVKNKWEKSSWGKKLIVQKRRAAMNDFDRFKVMLARIKVGWLVNFIFCKIHKRIVLIYRHCFFSRDPLLLTKNWPSSKKRPKLNLSI